MAAGNRRRMRFAANPLPHYNKCCMDVSIVIPAYNEANRIGTTLETIVRYFGAQSWSWEIIVADDGSEDHTASLVEDWAVSRESAVDGRLRVVRLAHRGKGAAVAVGVAQARGRWVLMTDADLSTPIAEWARVERELAAGAQVVAGSRQIAGARIEVH